MYYNSPTWQNGQMLLPFSHRINGDGSIVCCGCLGCLTDDCYY